MIKQAIIGIFLVLLTVSTCFAQEGGEISLVFPQGENWNKVLEGQELNFRLEAQGGLSGNYRFRALADSAIHNFSLKENGQFSWTPDYSLVPPDEIQRTYPIIFEVQNEGGQQSSRQVEFVVVNQSRITKFHNPLPFLVKPSQKNVYPLSFRDSDFSVNVSSLPQGITFDQMEFSWNPTETQWLKLENQPLEIQYDVIDNEFGDRQSVSVRVEQDPDTEPAQVASNSDNLPSLELILPGKEGWNVVREGEVMTFKLNARGGDNQQYSFNMLQGTNDELGISFDTLGNFYWKPSYDQVARLEEEQLLQLIFEVKNANGLSDRKQVELLVYHQNRTPQVGELRTFYIQHNTENVYQLGKSQAISDPDDDPLVFKPILAQMPQGMTLSGNGELSWKPSYSQYARLQREPFALEFIVEDQPYKAQGKGKLRIAVTQQDHPPQITMVPANVDSFEIREDEALNLKFYLSDPNGDQDILAFDFVSETSRIPKDALIENDPTQWEFIWTPGYDFFVEPGTEENYEITFFVMDRTSQRSERKIHVTVVDAENLEEKDRLLYSQYREGLVRTMNLIDQLKERQKELQKEYRKAKKGKKQRAITTASLGAITGLSPVVLSDNQQTQRYVSGIGGTTSMTIGSLEASNVIGKDLSDIFENLSYINQKLNELESQGEVFAGKYALAKSRRDEAFTEDLKKLIVMLKLKNVTSLELDASWRNSRKPSDKNIQETFKSFNPDSGKSTIIND